MQQQDSSHETGVSMTGAQQVNVTRARDRKANAAIQLKLSGADWEEIAEAIGYPTPRAALVAVEKALESRLDTVDRKALREMAGARLERLLRAVWLKAIDPNHPEQMQAQAQAASRIDRHIKLFGLDAPTEVIVHTPTQTELEQWVARLVNKGNGAVEEFDIIEGEVLQDYEAEDWTEQESDAVPS